MAKRRKSRRKRPAQRVLKSTKSVRLLRRPFYFEDRRYVNERKRIRRPTKKKIFHAVITAKGVTPKSDKRSAGKFGSSRERDRVFEGIRRLGVCRRRSDRRKVLFSSGRAGKGRRLSKIRRMTKDSKVRC